MEVVVIMTFFLMIVENIVVSSTQRPAGGSTGTEEGRIQSCILRQAATEFQFAALAWSYHCLPERCCQGNEKLFYTICWLKYIWQQHFWICISVYKKVCNKYSYEITPSCRITNQQHQISTQYCHLWDVYITNSCSGERPCRKWTTSK